MEDAPPTATRRYRLLISVATLAATMLAVPGVATASSTGASGEKEVVDESFISQFWTTECGFEVHRHNLGHQRIWEEPRGNGTTVFRGVFAIAVTLTGVESGNTYRFQDAGTDRETLLEDGRVELAIIGRSFPVASIGRLVVLIDDDDEEVVKVSGRTAYDPAAICASLAP
jgi:hypothetical protein